MAPGDSGACFRSAGLSALVQEQQIEIETGSIDDVGPTFSIIQGEILRKEYPVNYGFSVRCIKDD